MPRWVYSFGEGAASSRNPGPEMLGQKGAGLVALAELGLPVPPGFIISAEVCTDLNEGREPVGLKDEIDAALADLQERAGRRFGDADAPLLVSVRPGSRAPMPGIIDTVLNLGLDRDLVTRLASSHGARFAYELWRRFIQSFAEVVERIDAGAFESHIEIERERLGAGTAIPDDRWQRIAESFERLFEERSGRPFPSEPAIQLDEAIRGLFASWCGDRVREHRRLRRIPDSWGLAVTVQAMVFGNRDENSGAGTAVTRHPKTGAQVLVGEYLTCAQGDEAATGWRVPDVLTAEARAASGLSSPSLEERASECFAELGRAADLAEKHFKEPQRLEFTIDGGRLWLLQTMAAKLDVPATIKAVVDMAEAGTITKSDAVARIDPLSINQLLYPTIDPAAERQLLAKGLPASAGAAAGEIAFTVAEALAAAAEGRKVILVKSETSPEDVAGMDAAAGVLTTRGGMTSHAAVVARGMGRPCVAGASQIRIDERAGKLTVVGRTFSRGDVITIDGASGEVLKGCVRMRTPELSGDFATLMEWADDIRRMDVRANADTPLDARRALEFGAEGIGLCRTEHMFYEASRINIMREMILAETASARQRALDRLLPLQRDDFFELFLTMPGHTATIRLLDPPLHEFLPREREEIARVAEAMKVDRDRFEARVETLTEVNPMLGFRGCRLLATYPEITRMQTRAILEAAAAAARRTGRPVNPQIMVPFVSLVSEFEAVKAIIDETASEVCAQFEQALPYSVGTMIEIPRAALRAAELAQEAAFFSFGTNDLAQTTWGLSRDDASTFLQQYEVMGLIDRNPFSGIDQEGVGTLMRIAIDEGRRTKSDLEIGICGEHGGDPESIRFCESVGLSYVSCSPFRVPIARLAAARATLEHNNATGSTTRSHRRHKTS